MARMLFGSSRGLTWVGAAFDDSLVVAAGFCSGGGVVSLGFWLAPAGRKVVYINPPMAFFIGRSLVVVVATSVNI